MIVGYNDPVHTNAPPRSNTIRIHAFFTDTDQLHPLGRPNPVNIVLVLLLVGREELRLGPGRSGGRGGGGGARGGATEPIRVQASVLYACTTNVTIPSLCT